MLITPSVTLAALASADTSMVSLKFSSNSLSSSVSMGIVMTSDGIGSLSLTGSNAYSLGEKV